MDSFVSLHDSTLGSPPRSYLHTKILTTGPMQSSGPLLPCDVKLARIQSRNSVESWAADVKLLFYSYTGQLKARRGS